MSDEDGEGHNLSEHATMFDLRFASLEAELEIDSRSGKLNRHIISLATSLKATITAFAAKELGDEDLVKASLTEAAMSIKSLVERMLVEAEEFEKRSLARREKLNVLRRRVEDE